LTRFDWLESFVDGHYGINWPFSGRQTAKMSDS